MPFLQDISPGDAEALSALSYIADEKPDLLTEIVAMPAVSNGITDDITPRIAVLEAAARHTPHITAILLDPGQTPMEERSIILPLAGPVCLAVINNAISRPDALDILEAAVRTSEQLIDRPLPATAVILLFSDAVTPAFAGANYGSSIAVLPDFTDPDSRYYRNIYGSMVHEAAHSWWHGNADWIDEGMADIISLQARNIRDGRPLMPDEYPCHYAAAASELDANPPDKSRTDRFACNYSIGQQLFLQILEATGPVGFQYGTARLYDLSQIEDDTETTGTALTWRHIVQAFETNRAIVTRAYHNGPATQWPEPLNPSWLIPELNAQIVDAWIAWDDCDNRIAGSLPADASRHATFLCSRYEYHITDGERSIDLEVTEYGPDGLPYERRSTTATASSCYAGTTQGISIGPGRHKPWRPGTHLVTLRGDNGDLVIAHRFEVAE